MLVTRTPTSNTTPDPGQGGSAVNTPSNTGHSATVASCSGEMCLDLLTCIWQGFAAAPAGTKSAITLKATHTSSGIDTGITAINTFTLEYSLNGGGSWNTAVSRTNFTAAQGPTVFSVALPLSQDLTQVRVRDLIQATTDSALAHESQATVTISDIKIEVTLVDDFAVGVMM